MKVEISIVIEQPVEKVFAYVTNLENFPQWISETLAARFTTEGAVGVGSTAMVTKSLRGRKVEVKTEIVAFEPNKLMRARTTQGRAPVNVEYIFEPAQGGTKLTRLAEGEAPEALKLAMPLITQRYRRAWQNNFATLKKVLEAQK